jgi:hypothetical protein
MAAAYAEISRSSPIRDRNHRDSLQRATGRMGRAQFRSLPSAVHRFARHRCASGPNEKVHAELGSRHSDVEA